jgi:hypothetical protein
MFNLFSINFLFSLLFLFVFTSVGQAADTTPSEEARIIFEACGEERDFTYCARSQFDDIERAEVCEAMTKLGLGERKTDDCYALVAMITRDPEVCGLRTRNSGCLETAFNRRNDVSTMTEKYCKSLAEGRIKNRCFLFLVITKKTPEYCVYISDFAKKNECYMRAGGIEACPDDGCLFSTIKNQAQNLIFYKTGTEICELAEDKQACYLILIDSIRTHIESGSSVIKSDMGYLKRASLMELCEQFSDQSKINTCRQEILQLDYFAWWYSVDEFCGVVSESGKSQCYLDFAKAQRSFCSEGKPQRTGLSADGWYYKSFDKCGQDENKAIKEICNQINDEEKKESCLILDRGYIDFTNCEVLTEDLKNGKNPDSYEFAGSDMGYCYMAYKGIHENSSCKVPRFKGVIEFKNNGLEPIKDYCKPDEPKDIIEEPSICELTGQCPYKFIEKPSLGEKLFSLIKSFIARFYIFFEQ